MNTKFTLLALFVSVHSLPVIGETIKSDSVTVTGTTLSTNYQQSLLDQKEILKNVAGGTNLVEIDNSSRQGTLDDVLKHQPGIIIQSFFGGIDQPRLNIRGSGVQTAPLTRGVTLLQDGLPINDADGEFHISLLDMKDNKFVSIRRGANAFTPTSNALGGELDFISYTGLDENGRVRYDYGSFGRQGWQAAIGNSGEKWDGRISITGDRFSGYRKHSSSERNAIRTNFGFKANDHFKNHSWLSYTAFKFDVAGTLPQDGVKNYPRDVSKPIFIKDPHRHVEQARIANKATWTAQSSQLEWSIWAHHTHDNFITPKTYILNSGNTYGSQLLFNQQFSENIKFRSALGLDHTKTNRNFFANEKTPNPATSKGNFDLTASNQYFSLGGSYQFIDVLSLNSDIKATHATRKIHQQNGVNHLTQSWHFLTPKVGLIWSPNENQQWFTNISRSNEPASFRELLRYPANKVALSKLDVQKALTFEVGGNGKLNSALNWTLSAYHSRVKDEIITHHDQDGNPNKTVNYRDKTRHQGIEAGINGDVDLPLGALNYQTSWTFNDFRFTGGEFKGNRLAGIPRQQITGEVLYRINGWHFGPNIQWVPNKTPVDHANSYSIQYRDSYALVGLTLRYRHQTGWNAYLMADNLTNKRYAAASQASMKVQNKTDSTSFPGMGRSFNAGIAYQF